MPIDKDYLVYWDEEDSVKVVCASAVEHWKVDERKVAKIGMEPYEDSVGWY